MNRVLVVDDEPAILRLLGAVLARGGYEAAGAATASAALATLRGGGLSAAILDLGLPDRDGLELIPLLRAAHVPVIVLSAREDVGEKVAALDLGASDYITKPFDGEELLARLRVALRQSGHPSGATQEVLAYGPLRIDTARHEASIEGRALTLPPKEFALLQALVEAGGRILTHAALLEKVWGRAHVGDVEYLRVAIRALRLKVEEDPAHPRLIRNEPGIGYRLMEA
ncbi:response regulator transcription factor [Novosphingobium sediminicola]|uniref:Two-component system KDP operon response regulator KdpE n=1 Tax=Novosphingobium sediminicola TaxID=563162 RepID=A0A7W6CID6_9SPHN|nr:response regulator transcription factor [Novosphingobium sediminicola]MBB3954938.1 two-component system KDP operon response regulator KdpE [Novosphingobium sediminicola]